MFAYSDSKQIFSHISDFLGIKNKQQIFLACRWSVNILMNILGSNFINLIYNFKHLLIKRHHPEYKISIINDRNYVTCYIFIC